MSLIQQIDTDLKNAMRARDATTLGVLRMLKSALKYAAIEKSGAGGELDDAEAVQIVRREIKKREDSIAGYEKASRADLVEKEKAEAAILANYLPQALSSGEITRIVREAIAETGATGKAQMGAVMKVASAKSGGRADGRTLSAEVSKQLSANV